MKFYWEEYYDQLEDSGFNYIGTSEETMVPIVNLRTQVNELKRLYGKNVTVKLFKEVTE